MSFLKPNTLWSKPGTMLNLLKLKVTGFWETKVRVWEEQPYEEGSPAVAIFIAVSKRVVTLHVTEGVKHRCSFTVLGQWLWAEGNYTLWCCQRPSRMCAQGGSHYLILRQPEYNISHRNVLLFLSSSLSGVLS